MTIDDLIIAFDRSLRTVLGPARTVRPVPGEDLPEAPLAAAQKRHVAALMRINHVGEVCAQALYQGQALTARDPVAREALAQAADEETEHLAWTERRIAELGSHRSWLNPLWYTGSYAIGVVAGIAGDRWNLGFLAETERQVVRHLEGHLQKLPLEDERSRAVLEAMKADEERHATTAITLGASDLPLPVKMAMRAASRVMTATAYWV